MPEPTDFESRKLLAIAQRITNDIVQKLDEAAEDREQTLQAILTLLKLPENKARIDENQFATTFTNRLIQLFRQEKAEISYSDFINQPTLNFKLQIAELVNAASKLSPQPDYAGNLNYTVAVVTEIRKTTFLTTQLKNANYTSQQIDSLFLNALKLSWACYKAANPSSKFNDFRADPQFSYNLSATAKLLANITQQDYFHQQTDQTAAYNNLTTAVVASLSYTPIGTDQVPIYDSTKITLANLSENINDPKFQQRMAILLPNAIPPHMLHTKIAALEMIGKTQPTITSQSTTINFTERPDLKTSLQGNISSSFSTYNDLTGIELFTVEEAATTIESVEEANPSRAQMTTYFYRIDTQSSNLPVQMPQPKSVTQVNPDGTMGNYIVSDGKTKHFFDTYIKTRLAIPPPESDILLERSYECETTGYIQDIDGNLYFEQTAHIKSLYFQDDFSNYVTIPGAKSIPEYDRFDTTIQGTIAFRYKFNPTTHKFDTFSSAVFTGTPKFVALCEIAAFYPNLAPSSPTAKEAHAQIDLATEVYLQVEKKMEKKGLNKKDYLGTDQHRELIFSAYEFSKSALEKQRATSRATSEIKTPDPIVTTHPTAKIQYSDKIAARINIQIDDLYTRLILAPQKSTGIFSFYKTMRASQLSQDWVSKLNLLLTIRAAHQQGKLHIQENGKLVITGDVTDVMQGKMEGGTFSQKVINTISPATFNAQLLAGDKNVGYAKGLKNDTTTQIIRDIEHDAKKKNKTALQNRG